MRMLAGATAGVLAALTALTLAASLVDGVALVLPSPPHALSSAASRPNAAHCRADEVILLNNRIYNSLVRE